MVKKRIKELKTLYKKPSYRFDENPEKYLKISNDIEKNGFDYEKSKILITSDNFIINGHHRHYILKSIYDDDYLINVRQLPINRLTYLISTNIIFIPTLPVMLLIYFITKLFKKKKNSYENEFK